MTGKNVMGIMPDASEIIHYDNPDFPVYIKNDDISDYPGHKALCHWHDDIELIHITEGKMNYHISGRSVLLCKQECLFVNSKQFHYGYSHLQHGCKFICIRFNPKILGGSLAVYKDYVIPLIENEEITYLYYDRYSQNRQNIADLMTYILRLKSETEEACELEIISALHSLWRFLLLECKDSIQPALSPEHSDLALQKKMVSFIYEHYQEILTLDMISSAASISRSKCCIIFRQYLQQSPIDFLNKYRLEVSRYLLTNTASSITEIALSCGFNHLSYFSKLFFREYTCTPTEYRKSNV